MKSLSHLSRDALSASPSSLSGDNIPCSSSTRSCSRGKSKGRGRGRSRRGRQGTGGTDTTLVPAPAASRTVEGVSDGVVAMDALQDDVTVFEQFLGRVRADFSL